MSQDEVVNSLLAIDKELHELNLKKSDVARKKQPLQCLCNHTYRGKSILEPLGDTKYLTCKACHFTPPQ